MAIDTGIALDCAQLVEVGGLQNIFVTDLDNLATVTTGGITKYTNLVGTVDWAMFQLKPNTATWATTSTKENGVTKFETTVSWYVPNIGESRLSVLEGMKNKCIVAVAELRNGKFRTCGISEAFGGFGFNQSSATDWIYNDTYATMTVEETSGADFVDGNGFTITLVAPSFETPRTYSGAISPLTGNTQASIA